MWTERFSSLLEQNYRLSHVKYKWCRKQMILKSFFYWLEHITEKMQDFLGRVSQKRLHSLSDEKSKSLEHILQKTSQCNGAILNRHCQEESVPFFNIFRKTLWELFLHYYNSFITDNIFNFLTSNLYFLLYSPVIMQKKCSNFILFTTE